MLPRICSKQLLFIPVVFIIVWFIFNFVALFDPGDLLNVGTPSTKRLHIIDNIGINVPITSTARSKPPYAIPNANYIKDAIKSRKDRLKAKLNRSSASTATANVGNLTQSAINLSISEIRKIVEKINAEQRVMNAEKFKISDSDMVVIAVQVHNRKVYLEYLINSLRKADGISNALLIFSHDFYDEDINKLIGSIDFCRVMQIFYPLSMQLVPDKFPGTDPKDCPPDISKPQAEAIACQNAFNPDSYGHFRNAKIVQLKHHWWWKANSVFNLKPVRKYKGPVIFLEEDLYVIEDFIPTMKLMHETAKINCKTCKIFSLAANLEAVFQQRVDFTRSSSATVKSQFSNMGLAFTAETWREMQDCAHTFCRFDDYNWDISLQHVFTTCMSNTASMTLNAPRVFHLGSCGTHHTAQNCDSTQKIREINNMVMTYHKYLYPKRLELIFNVDHMRSDVFYGGWGDARDQGLCLKHVLRL